jgi:hypothetical protein
LTLQKLSCLLIGLPLFACTPNGSFVASSTISNTSTNTGTSTSSTLTGIRATQVIFQSASSVGGSFNSLLTQGNSQGTVPLPGRGHPAVRVFNSDGSFQGSINPTTGVTQGSWPAWLSSFEVGVSGPANTASLNPNCATFAGNSEATSQNCFLGPTASPVPSQCGAPLGQFRISEVDCSIPSGGTPATATGSGGPADGVYLRAVFNRAYLGANENILAVIQYSSSALDPAPANPSTCFLGGKFSPESCSDFVWKVFLKHSANETALPFMLFVPPTFSSVLGTAQVPASTSGMGIAAKQFILPLASDPTLSVFQISRIQSAFPGNGVSLIKACTATNTPPTVNSPGNSPLCAGVVFYTITFYRV